MLAKVSPSCHGTVWMSGFNERWYHISYRTRLYGSHAVLIFLCSWKDDQRARPWFYLQIEVLEEDLAAVVIVVNVQHCGVFHKFVGVLIVVRLQLRALVHPLIDRKPSYV